MSREVYLSYAEWRKCAAELIKYLKASIRREYHIGFLKSKRKTKTERNPKYADYSKTPILFVNDIRLDSVKYRIVNCGRQQTNWANRVYRHIFAKIWGSNVFYYNRRNLIGQICKDTENRKFPLDLFKTVKTGRNAHVRIVRKKLELLKVDPKKQPARTDYAHRYDLLGKVCKNAGHTDNFQRFYLLSHNGVRIMGDLHNSEKPEKWLRSERIHIRQSKVLSSKSGNQKEQRSLHDSPQLSNHPIIRYSPIQSAA